MEVNILKRNVMGWPVGTVTVTISDRCPVCGGKRGEPQSYSFCEDGEWYSIDQWQNPCGHVDKYVNVLKEAAAAHA